ncbi:hypothetical protein [Sulfurovum sp.]|uniref:hypothetical protein n=1 Tax=Sulfurovum sp. TaxID=1969726 RepID=UPI002A36B938|nr:hypothetical protein [Sulfurovum sp.]MDD2450391.1 hypothetical protein [Sulfurovum sp.]MDD3498833.1 hypothetical protein [Sulfurovum sp.]MDY0403296.1 hypothetical protein [Sulfurovum sp.]
MTWEQRKQLSLTSLKKYRRELSRDSYYRIKKVIGNQAIENQFLNETTIHNLVRKAKGEITTNELIQEHKKHWGIA